MSQYAASEPRDRDAPRARSRSRSPARSNNGFRSPYRRKSPPPKRPSHAPIQAPNPSAVLGVFGLSIRTQERDLDEEFSRFGRVEKVTIVYDQRSDRSRGFGFIKMSSVEEATRCIQELNGIELNGRRIRVDYSVTDRPHAPTPGEYMGHRRSHYRDTYSSRDSHRDSYRDRDRDHRRHDRDRDRDPYGRDNRDWRNAGVIQEARREVAALARISMVLPMAPLTPPTMPKMAVVGEVPTCAMKMPCSVFICLLLVKGSGTYH
ncbi:transformer-2-beta [Tylopilus felleus]